MSHVLSISWFSWRRHFFDTNTYMGIIYTFFSKGRINLYHIKKNQGHWPALQWSRHEVCPKISNLIFCYDVGLLIIRLVAYFKVKSIRTNKTVPPVLKHPEAVMKVRFRNGFSALVTFFQWSLCSLKQNFTSFQNFSVEFFIDRLSSCSIIHNSSIKNATNTLQAIPKTEFYNCFGMPLARWWLVDPVRNNRRKSNTFGIDLVYYHLLWIRTIFISEMKQKQFIF